MLKSIPVEDIKQAFLDYPILISDYKAARAAAEEVKTKRLDFVERMRVFVDNIDDKKDSPEEIRRQLNIYLDEDRELDAHFKTAINELQDVHEKIENVKHCIDQFNSFLQNLLLAPPAPSSKQ